MNNAMNSALYRITLSCFSVFFLALLTSGCAPSSRPPGMPSLHPAAITITQEGTPVSGVSIRLVPETPTEWPVASTTNDSGIASLVTYGQFSGAPEGTYKMVLSKAVHEEVEAAKDAYTSASVDIYSVIAVEYTRSDTTPLEITIKRGRNAQTFDVGAPVRVLVDSIRPGT